VSSIDAAPKILAAFQNFERIFPVGDAEFLGAHEARQCNLARWSFHKKFI